MDPMSAKWKPHHDIAVVGAGPVGTLLAIILKKEGLCVALFEKGPDESHPQNQTGKGGGRSINLVVTSRGIHALKEVDLWEKVKQISVPVFGRLIHSSSGQLTYQPYEKNEKECNYSISRQELGQLLRQEATKLGVPIYFNSQLKKWDGDTNTLVFASPDRSGDGDSDDDSDGNDNGNGPDKMVMAKHILGADGAGSRVRKELMNHLQKKKLSHHQEISPLGSSYQEFYMPPTPKGHHPMEKKALHIWPRGKRMLMGLANRDGSFTMTLYLPDQGPGSFAQINSEQKLRELFAQDFADAIPFMPHYWKNYQEKSIGRLATLRAAPWHYRDQVALVGDAAHAIVPFFGQGMNAGFEDCTCLRQLMARFPGQWGKIFATFDSERRPEGQAIAEMALDNFEEMSARVGDQKFLLRKEVEQKLEETFPAVFRSRYALVTHSLVSYTQAQQRGKIVDAILDELCGGLAKAADLDLNKAALAIERFTKLSCP